MKIKSIDEISEKYSRVTPQRSADYQAGIANPKNDWKTATAAAEGNWEGGIQAAMANKSFAKGVNRVGSEKWQRKALDVGVARWAPGVAAAKDDYRNGFAPYQQELASMTLPPRGPKGDPRNIERVAKIAMALHNKKLKG